MYLITGATGFIGWQIASSLSKLGKRVRAAVRVIPSVQDITDPCIEWNVVSDINSETDWRNTLKSIEVVVHCAAQAHVIPTREADALAAYREVNVEGTIRLAQLAAEAGVRRFVFISSIGVNGKQSFQPFTEACAPQPHDAYSDSKLEGEQALLALSARTGMEVVIIRPPLVYGPGARGSFAKLMHWVERGFPIPLGAVQNQRSFVALENLVSLVLLCADPARSPQAANQVFVVADGEDVSTTTLLRKVALYAGRPSRLLPVPPSVLRFGARLLGKRAMADRLLDNLQVDATKARTLLGWRPVVTMDEQLASMFAKTCTSTDAELAKEDSHSLPLIRVLDVVLSATGLIVLWPLLLLVFVVNWFDTRSPLFTQERVGRHQQPFVLVKFRTMRPGTSHLPSHLVSSASITSLGAMLRRTKLDELPQLWNVLLGHMSLVGPRPGLYNHHELTKARADQGVYAARPGITGLAQINGIDMSTPEILAQTDARMLRELNLRSYFRYIFQTVLGKGSGDRVKK